MLKRKTFFIKYVETNKYCMDLFFSDILKQKLLCNYLPRIVYFLCVVNFLIVWFLFTVSTAMSEDALTNQYVGLVIGVLAAVILLLIIIIFIIIARNKRRKHTTPHTILKPVDNRVTINMKVSSYKS